MIIKGSNFIPAPEGVHDAVCVDFIDRGPQTTPWGTKHKCRIVFQIDKRMDPVPPKKVGDPFIVGATFTVSLADRAGLRKFLKSWRGRDFTPEELAGFDTENVIGAQAQIVVVHEEKKGEIYANITTIMKGKAKLTPDPSYVRDKDRPKDNKGPNPPERNPADEPPDDHEPF